MTAVLGNAGSDIFFLLREENAALHARIATLEVEIVDLRAQLETTTKRAEAKLRQPRIKPSTADQPANKRKIRATNTTRLREPATREVRHEPAVCPHCGRPLDGAATEHHRRQVIDIPLTRYEVVDHVICSCHCGYCGQRVMAQPSAEEVGALPR